VVVVSGPSGAGKSTVIGHLLNGGRHQLFRLRHYESAPPRGDEGVRYFFLSGEFDALVAQGELLEHAEYAGNCYGTPKARWRKSCGRAAPLSWTSRSRGGPGEGSHAEAVLVFLTPPD
jgi:guanylate kinase